VRAQLCRGSGREDGGESCGWGLESWLLDRLSRTRMFFFHPVNGSCWNLMLCVNAPWLWQSNCYGFQSTKYDDCNKVYLLLPIELFHGSVQVGHLNLLTVHVRGSTLPCTTQCRDYQLNSSSQNKTGVLAAWGTSEAVRRAQGGTIGRVWYSVLSVGYRLLGCGVR